MIKEVEYKSRYNLSGNTTQIKILYNGFRVLTLEFYGQLQPAAVEEYAKDAIEILKEKGVIKTENAKK